MDKAEAIRILREHLERYRRRAYRELAELVGHIHTENVVAPSGQQYQLEFQILWDDRKGGAIRVLGSVDDGGLCAFAPLSDDFIMAPDGRLVGE